MISKPLKSLVACMYRTRSLHNVQLEALLSALQPRSPLMAKLMARTPSRTSFVYLRNTTIYCLRDTVSFQLTLLQHKAYHLQFVSRSSTSVHSMQHSQQVVRTAHVPSAWGSYA